jgi:hypothetical protein
MLLYLYTYVSIACFKFFIYFRHMLQMFHLDVLKVDRGVARCGRWLVDSSVPQPPVVAVAMGFPMRAQGGRGGAGLANGRRRWCWAGHRMWGLRLDATSRPDVWALGLPLF